MGSEGQASCLESLFKASSEAHIQDISLLQVLHSRAVHLLNAPFLPSLNQVSVDAGTALPVDGAFLLDGVVAPPDDVLLPSPAHRGFSLPFDTTVFTSRPVLGSSLRAQS